MDLDAARDRMVRDHLMARGITDRGVLSAMREVPREVFVPDEIRAQAYEDGALPIGRGQTISQPYVVAWMIEAMGVSPDARVLDVGTGSGYAAAVLSRCCGEVVSIERHAPLAAEARRRLADLGYDNVTVVVGDGIAGHVDRAPYDAIGVAARSAEIPPALVDQLRDGGRLVIPLGPEPMQQLTVVERRGAGVRTRKLGGVHFVPLLAGVADT